MSRSRTALPPNASMSCSGTTLALAVYVGKEPTVRCTAVIWKVQEMIRNRSSFPQGAANRENRADVPLR
jgi:hypothetical protein